MNPTYTEAVNMKTGTPNFFPIGNVLRFMDYYKQMLEMGMDSADNVHVFSVSDKGHAGTYRLEADHLSQEPGFYVWMDNQPVLNQINLKTPKMSAEDLFYSLIEMKKLNQGLKPWEQVSKPLAEVRGEEGVVRLYNSGVIALVTQYGGHLADDLVSTGKTDQLEPLMKLILGLVSGPEDNHVKFYKL